MKFYDADACCRKATQHWEMAGLARQDGDKTDAQRHSALACAWTDRARQGGCYEKDAPK